MALLLLASCGHKNEYTIEGHLAADGFNHEKVYLLATDGQTVLDSTTVVDGLFLMNGTVESPAIVTLQASNGNDGYYGELVLEAGKIYIDIVHDSLSGTPLNDKFASYRYATQNKADQNALRDLASRIQSMPDEQSQAAMMPRYDSLSNVMIRHSITRAEQFYAQNPDNILGAYALNEMAQLENMSYAKFDSLINAAAPAVAQYRPNQERLALLRVIERTSAGHPYVDVAGTLFAKNAAGTYAMGQPTNLKQLIDGKVAIVDFWASWCGPCKQEIRENLIRIAKKYEKQGLVVVGVDVHDTEEGLAAAAAQMAIPYPIMVAGGDPGKDYGFNSIPQIFLIGNDGIIIARDLRGDDIEKAVAAALGAK